MKKTIVSLMLLLYLIFFSAPIYAQAEPETKFYVQVDFIGAPEGETYYAALLSEVFSTGGYYAWDGKEQHAKYQEGDPDYEIWKAFVAYEDPDGYFFLQKFTECSGNYQMVERYLRPTFKILVYYPESDSFFCTEVLERYDEASLFTIDLSSGTVTHGESEEDRLIRNLESAKVLMKAVKAIPGIMVLTGVALNVIKKMKKKTAKAPVRVTPTEISKNPDTPRMLGYKTGWLAIKSSSPEAVMKKLGMKNPRVANWETGLANRTGKQYFVTPVMDGYVIVSDVLEDFTENPDKLDKIATQFEEVLFFGTHRIVELCTWVKYVNGGKVRRYYYLGESGEVVSEGELTIEEYRLGFKAFPVSEDIDWESEETLLPDEDSVMNISKAWGVDPFFEAHATEPSTGYLAEFESPY